MGTNTPRSIDLQYTPRALRKMAVVDRDAILRAAAAKAEHDYLHNRELTAFEAFGPDDLYGDSANAEPR